MMKPISLHRLVSNKMYISPVMALISNEKTKKCLQVIVNRLVDINTVVPQAPPSFSVNAYEVSCRIRTIE
jgi:hypothetical protein